MKSRVIKDFEKLKEEVDAKCKNADTLLKEFSESGKELRDKLLLVGSLLPSYRVLYTNAEFIYGLQQERVDKAKALAIKNVDNNPEYAKSAAINRKLYLDIVEVEIDGEITTYNDEKVRMVWVKYAVDRFRYACEDIKSLLMTYQSALNFDKEEAKSLTYST